MQGYCVFYLPEKGYGFVRTDDAVIDDPDIFVHHSQVPARKYGRKYLIKGERVEFDLGERAGKPQALKVKPLAVTPAPTAPVTPTNGGNSNGQQ
jgi:cold shock CspA family protein